MDYDGAQNALYVFCAFLILPSVPIEAEKLQKIVDSKAIVVDNIERLKAVLKNGK